MQGEIRAKFEENHLDATEFLSRYFPPNIDEQPYKRLVENELNRMIDYLTNKFSIDAEIHNLASFTIAVSDKPSESLVFSHNLRSHKVETKQFIDIISKIDELVILLNQMTDLQVDEDDRTYFETQRANILKMRSKYQTRANEISLENQRIEAIAKSIQNVASRHNRSISDRQKKLESFESNTNTLKETVISILKKLQKLQRYSPHIEEVSIAPNTNTIFDYQFISRLNVDKLNTEYFLSHIAKVIRSKSSIDWETITEKKLRDILLKYDESKPVLQFFKEVMLDSIENDFLPKKAIIYQGMDKSDELSSGLNSKIYFDLLSYENTRDGIYIVDQPEDNVSQTAIKTYLLARFKTMGENRQIIMVTHNPQFIVNLDVDNIIYIFQDGDGFNAYSGALEYADDTYSILDIVAKNIDGGLDSIKKRWKRYEKITAI